VTWHLLWIAACLFLFDVAIRRVMIGRDSFDRLFAGIRGVLRPAPIGAPSHVAGLAAAKRGAAPQPPPARPPVPGTSSGIPTRPSVPGAGSGLPNPNAAPPAGGPPLPDRPVIKPSAPPRTNPDAPPPAGPAPGAGGNLAGSLLDRVKKNQKK
jgi:hypothetical protein